MTEERDDILVLVDENGEEVEFEYLDTVEYEGEEYVVLIPVKAEEAEVDEVVILRLEEGENGEDAFATVEDDEILNAVFEEFKAGMEEDEEEE